MMTIGMIPGPTDDLWNSEGNRLLPSMRDSLAVLGHQVIGLTWDDILAEKYLPCDVLHFHWATAFFPLDSVLPNLTNQILGPVFARVGTPEIIRRMFRSQIRESFEESLKTWKTIVTSLKRPIVWELHDLGSHHLKHDSLYGELDRATNRLFWDYSDVVLLHEPSCQRDAEEYFGNRPRGSYSHVPIGPLDALPPVSKEEARDSLGLGAHEVVFSYVGTARPNRNPQRIVNLFRRRFPNTQLLVAGMGVDQYVGRRPRCRVFSGYTPAKTLRDIYCASDYVLNSASQYLTSGVMRSAMNYGVPVLCHPTGSNTDMVSGAALFFPSKGMEATVREACAIIGTDRYKELQQNANRRNAERQWDQVASKLVIAYRSAIEHRSGGSIHE